MESFVSCFIKYANIKDVFINWNKPREFITEVRYCYLDVPDDDTYEKINFGLLYSLECKYSFAASLGILWARLTCILWPLAIVSFLFTTEINGLKDIFAMVFMFLIAVPLGVALWSTIFFTPLLITPFHFFRKKQKKIDEKIIWDEYEKVKNRIESVKYNIKEKQEEHARWQLELDREIERERRLSEVHHESTIAFMEMQVALYAKYKEKGLSVEKEIFEMREKLLKMEGEENKAMLDEIKTTLDSLS